MKILLAVCLTVCAACSVANAQTQAVPGAFSSSAASSSPNPTSRAADKAKASQADRPAHPDAVYPKPSGQDSQPKNPAPPATKDKDAKTDPSASKATPAPGARPAPYTGAAGKTKNPSTACSTARTNAKGQLDCGTGGNGATNGKIVTK